jgi:hypothetical protein
MKEPSFVRFDPGRLFGLDRRVTKAFENPGEASPAD